MPPPTEGARLFPLLTLRERQGSRTRSTPFRCGIPLPQGYCFQQRQLMLVCNNGVQIPASIQATALWPDHSIQWCLLQISADLDDDEELQLGIKKGLPVPHNGGLPEMRLDEREGSLQITTSNTQLRIDTRELRLFDIDGYRGFVNLRFNGRELPAQIDDYSYLTVTGHGGPLAIEVTLRGTFRLDEKHTLKFSCDLHISPDGRRIDGAFRLHNPAAATHFAGLWDLGDPNSVLFESLDLGFIVPDSKSGALRIDRNSPAIPFKTALRLTQHASGGENWNSPVHVNRDGDLTLCAPGYSLHIDGEHSHGKRATPVLTVDDANGSLHATLHQFWERFPSEIAACDGRLSLGVFPRSATHHELQPGERNTQRFSFAFEDAADTSNEATPGLQLFPELHFKFDAEHVARCALPGLGEPGAIDTRLLVIAEEGLSGSQNFFAKRETIDEYGWRNFGDLYADHETDGYVGERPFVSHYNNQYDPLFGFIRLFLQGEDRRWLELAQDLSGHTKDIDIYHTSQDRPEYNHGLFWHTDHYLPAETATHRSYSERQPSDAYEGHARGGGPGGQHCYTTGLLFHYLISGDDDSRAALYGLRDWIGRVYEGSGTLTDVVLAVKNRHRRDLKNQLTGRYPLDRGVANYLQTLLDCYSLDRRASILTQIGGIIRNTLHPADAIAERHLENVEDHWFYVVFLQAMTRYLTVKFANGETDSDFYYARDALLHYADWMLDNEAPYLDRPEILEFPNHTWTAQDLRKSNVLFEAAHWAPEVGAAYANKAQMFVDHVAQTLAQEDTRQYTRILALVMQNLYPTAALPALGDSMEPRGRYSKPRAPGLLRQSGRLLGLTLHALRHLRPHREFAAARRLLAVGRPAKTPPR